MKSSLLILLGGLSGTLVGCSASQPREVGAAGFFEGNMPADRSVFAPADAIYIGADVSRWGGASLLIVDYPWACENELAKRRVRNGHAVEIVWPNLANVISDPTRIPAGVYSVADYNTLDPRSTLVVYEDMGSTCGLDDLPELPDAVGGMVTIEQNEAGLPLSGSIDVTFAKDEHLTGHFTANLCASLQTKFGDPGFAGPCLPPVVCTSVDAATGSADGDSTGVVSVRQCQ
jgi:hypothetical protein